VKRLRQYAPHALEYRQPVGWATLILLPFFLALTTFGLLMTVLQFGEFGAYHASGPGDGCLLLFVGAFLLFFAWRFGSLAVQWFGRIKTTLDKAEGSVTVMWGLLYPLFPSVHRPLAEFRELQIVHVAERRWRHTHYEHRLLLAGYGGASVRIGRHSSYNPIRAMAEEVGSFLGLPVVDETATPPVVLPPDVLCLPLSVQAARYRPPHPGAPPDGSRLKCGGLGGRVAFEFPPARPDVWLVLYCLFAAAAVVGLAAAVAYFLMTDPGGLICPGILGAFALLLLAALFPRPYVRRVRLALEDGRFEAATRGLFFRSLRSLAVDDVREVRAERTALTLIATRGRITVGSLKAAEAEWVRDVILWTLAGAEEAEPPPLAAPGMPAPAAPPRDPDPRVSAPGPRIGHG
jgi:hypothetical protein